MKKFVFLFYGYAEPTEEVRAAWRDWFERVGAGFVDTGNPFGAGREITTGGARDLDSESSPISGYTIVQAASLTDAEKLLDGLPIVDSVRIYEALPM